MSQETPPGKKRGLTRPIEVVRAELLKDPDTKRIAKTVGMPLEEYVELVLEYAQDKDKQPELNVADEADMRAAGYNPPSAEDVANFLVAAAKEEQERGTQFEKSEFSESRAGAGKPSLTSPASSAALKGNPELLDQVKKGSGNKV